MVDLSALPTPQVIEVLDVEAIIARKKADFQALWAAVKSSNPDLDLPDYDVSMLETDPAMIQLEQSAYDELLIRDRINEAVRSNLLPFSAGSDLDALAADHGITRLDGETDKQLQERIVLADQGQSCAGPEEWYKLQARSVSADVADVAIYRTGTGPEIVVAVLSVSNGGVASDALLGSVLNKLTEKGVKGFNDVISVERAVKEVVDVAADIWLLPDAPQAVFDGLEALLIDDWEAESGIGFDLLKDWIKARLMPSGVYKAVVTSPASDKIADDNTAFAIGTVTLSYKGRMR